MRNHVDAKGIFIVYIVGFIVGLFVIKFFKKKEK